MGPGARITKKVIAFVRNKNSSIKLETEKLKMKKLF
jgi:hypothetical protein